jgi:hypothetical protein
MTNFRFPTAHVDDPILTTPHPKLETPIPKPYLPNSNPKV